MNRKKLQQTKGIDTIVALKHVPEEKSDDEIKAICLKFGPITNFVRLPVNKSFVFVAYQTKSMAHEAVMRIKLDAGLPIEASYALDYHVDSDNSNCKAKFDLDSYLDHLQPLRKPNRNILQHSVLSLSHPYRMCSYCSQYAEFNCERCGDFYCSLKCQQSDWENHKPICLPLMSIRCLPRKDSTQSAPDMDFKSIHNPHLTDAKKLHADRISKCSDCKNSAELLISSTIPLFAKTIPSNTNVYISHIINHRLMHVRPAFDLCESYLLNLYDDLNRYGVSAKPLTELPKCGATVLVCVNKEYYRALILEVWSQNREITVFFIDFGNTDNVWICQLSELSDDLKNRPILLNKIALKDVPDNISNENPLKFLKNVHEFEMKLKLKYDEEGETTVAKAGQPRECYLHFLFENLTVNEKINRLNCVEKGEKMQIQELETDLYKEFPIFAYDIEWCYVEGANVKMIIVDNSLLVDRQLLCVPEANKQLFDRHMKKITHYCQFSKDFITQKAYKPVLQEVCLVKRSHNWCRAFCSDNHSLKKALMVLLDYDDVITVEFDDIKKLPPSLAFPVLSLKCNIREFGDLSLTTSSVSKLKDVLKVNQVIQFDNVVKSTENESYCDVSLSKSFII